MLPEVDRSVVFLSACVIGLVCTSARNLRNPPHVYPPIHHPLTKGGDRHRFFVCGFLVLYVDWPCKALKTNCTPVISRVFTRISRCSVLDVFTCASLTLEGRARVVPTCTTLYQLERTSLYQLAPACTIITCTNLYQLVPQDQTYLYQMVPTRTNLYSRPGFRFRV